MFSSRALPQRSRPSNPSDLEPQGTFQDPAPRMPQGILQRFVGQETVQSAGFQRPDVGVAQCRTEPRQTREGTNFGQQQTKENLSTTHWNIKEVAASRIREQNSNVQDYYTSENASSILASFGLSNEDLEELSCYPDDQLTPENMPQILREIQMRKMDRHLPSLPPQSRGKETLGGGGSSMVKSKVIDYGHESKYGYTEDLFEMQTYSPEGPTENKTEEFEQQQDISMSAPSSNLSSNPLSAVVELIRQMGFHVGAPDGQSFFSTDTASKIPGLCITPSGLPAVKSSGLPAMAPGAQPMMEPEMQQPMSQPGMQQPMSQPRMQQPMSQPGMQQPMSQPGMQQPRMPQPRMPQPMSQSGMSQPGMPPPMSRSGMPPLMSRPGMPQPRMPQPMSRPGMPQPRMQQPMSRPGMPQPGMPQLMPQPGMPRPGMSRPGMPQRGMAPPMMPQRGMAPLMMQQRGMAPPMMPQHGMPQPRMPQPMMPQPMFQPGMSQAGMPLPMSQPGIPPPMSQPPPSSAELHEAANRRERLQHDCRGNRSNAESGPSSGKNFQTELEGPIQSPFGVVKASWLPVFSQADAQKMKRLPTPSMMNDYYGASPRIFPHTCSLCNVECRHLKDWFQHQTGSTHIRSCRQLRQQYPDWKPDPQSSLRRNAGDRKENQTPRRHSNSPSSSSRHSRGSGSGYASRRSRSRSRSPGRYRPTRRRSRSPRRTRRPSPRHRSRSPQRSRNHRSSPRRRRSRSSERGSGRSNRSPGKLAKLNEKKPVEPQKAGEPEKKPVELKKPSEPKKVTEVKKQGGTKKALEAKKAGESRKTTEPKEDAEVKVQEKNKPEVVPEKIPQTPAAVTAESNQSKDSEASKEDAATETAKKETPVDPAGQRENGSQGRKIEWSFCAKEIIPKAI
uniref:Uncharacterized protein n=1 Tax=Sphenodon punctatus TaxID=8508 RepID=A0A8D0GGQ8_SPHPU